MTGVDPPPPLPAFPVSLARIEAFVLRCPIETPVRTSFGTDANANPLRTSLGTGLADIRDGRVRLGASPGIGVEVDLAHLAALCTRR